MLPALGRAAVTWPHVDTPTSKGSKQATMDLVKMPLEMTKPTDQNSGQALWSRAGLA